MKITYDYRREGLQFSVKTYDPTSAITKKKEAHWLLVTQHHGLRKSASHAPV
jgi:hypothetical protein